MSIPAKSLLLNPRTYDPAALDDESRRILRATIDHLEGRGLRKLTEDYFDQAWYADFLDFVAKEKVFATFMTPARDADGRRDQALGHRAGGGDVRGPRLLRPVVLVPVAGHLPRPRPGVAERQRRGAGPSGRGARCRRRRARSASPSRTTAPTSTPPTWC